jgi:hypothetical protein
MSRSAFIVPECALIVPQCDGKELCNDCVERPLFCTYIGETRGNGNSNEAETETPAPLMQLEFGSAATDIAAGSVPRQKAGPKPKAAAAAKTPKRNVQKELGEAMSEFDMLKEKLAEAEERVRRLEAEKESQGLRTAAWRVKMSTNSAPHNQTAWPSLGILQPAGQDTPTAAERRPARQSVPKPRDRPA